MILNWVIVYVWFQVSLQTEEFMKITFAEGQKTRRKKREVKKFKWSDFGWIQTISLTVFYDGEEVSVASILALLWLLGNSICGEGEAVTTFSVFFFIFLWFSLLV